jgi:hypothetical protein
LEFFDLFQVIETARITLGWMLMRAKLSIFDEYSTSDYSCMGSRGSRFFLEKLFEILLVQMESLKMSLRCGFSSWLTMQTDWIFEAW